MFLTAKGRFNLEVKKLHVVTHDDLSIALRIFRVLLYKLSVPLSIFFRACYTPAP